MRAYVGITDADWYSALQSQPALEEVNFWQPGGNRGFHALSPGELFLFKLRAPNHFIVGGGVYAHSSLLPLSLAWESFGIANGARDLREMRERISRLRRRPDDGREDYTIGCILLEQPFFLDRNEWIPVPDWSPQIVQGKTYDVNEGVGLSMWIALQERLRHRSLVQPNGNEPRFGAELIVRPRLGQGSFRVMVTDAYARRCAVTGERVLPVLEAAHIRPYAQGGAHRVDNGLLLRSDLHTLFDRGYLTVTPSLQLEVSTRLREEFANGRDYYALQGKTIREPTGMADRPAGDFLRWHNETVFLG